MCDCSCERTDKNMSDVPSVKTVTIFEKCSKLPIQRTDYAAETLDGARLKQYDLKIRRCTISGEDEGAETECTCNKNYDEEVDVEYTLAMIKPEAIANRTKIERIIFEEGFNIQQSRCVQMTSEQVSEFYADGYGTIDFAHFVAYMASGPIVVKVLANKKAIQKWQLLMGPTMVAEARLYFPDSIRARYGTRCDPYKNSVHGSATREQAEREIHFFFPEVDLEPLLEGQNAENYLREVINRVLAKGLALCCKVKPIDPVLWLANWLLTNNPNFPKLILKNHAE